jgi:ADP-ribose pyrophosphatase YjhB (NUDIX family)
VAVFAFVVEDNRLLLIRQKEGDQFWGLPGGVVEVGESVDQAVIRELKEETGFDIQISGVVGLYSKPGADALAITFKGNIVGGQRQVADGEVQEVGFFALDAIPNPVRAHFHQRLADYCAGEQQPFLRTQ